MLNSGAGQSDCRGQATACRVSRGRCGSGKLAGGIASGIPSASTGQLASGSPGCQAIRPD